VPNYLKTPKLQQVTALLELGWTYRRIQSETGVRRETISRYDRIRQAKAAKVFAGSDLPPRSSAAFYRDAIVSKLDTGLSVQRIWQDLVEEYGFGYSYEAVKRFIRKVPRPQRAVGVFHSTPGEEGQVDFFQGAPTLDEASGQWKWNYGRERKQTGRDILSFLQ
jgi:hypothetical protein